MARLNQKKYRLHVSITTQNHTEQDVLCEIELPKRATEPVTLVLRPTRKQLAKLDGVFELSIYGEVRDVSGELRTVIRADSVYKTRSSEKSWGPELSEIVVDCVLVDLTVTDLLTRSEQSDTTKERLRGSFWLSPCGMLSPMYSIEHSFAGDTRITGKNNFEFTLSNGLHLVFDHHYQYFHGEDDETVSIPELVAAFDVEWQEGGVNSLLEGLDDFLLLTSFAARQFCVCVGWDSYDSSKVIDYFRRDIVIPEAKKKHGMHDGLIEMADFRTFMHTAYNRFIQIDLKDLIRQTFYRAIGRRFETIESSYLMLYSALESLVLFGRQDLTNEFILARAQWNNFRHELEAFIKAHPTFSADKRRRKLIYEKLQELNRVSFNSAFLNFCEQYHLELADLWPVIDRNDGVSLADVRNRLIHGDSFPEGRGLSLISARENLKWIVERSLLMVLGWPVAQSKVSKEYLSCLTMYKEWRDHRKVLSEVI